MGVSPTCRSGTRHNTHTKVGPRGVGESAERHFSVRGGARNGQSVQSRRGGHMSNEPEPVALTGQGVVTRPITGTVAEALERLLGVLKARGVKVFAVIDHSGEAAR